jgi:hypothetical protein
LNSHDGASHEWEGEPHPEFLFSAAAVSCPRFALFLYCIFFLLLKLSREKGEGVPDLSIASCTVGSK